MKSKDGAIMKDVKSLVHFKDGKIVYATNDGMELLGHFLFAQVGAKADFFKKWLQDPSEGAISSGPYFVYVKDDMVVLEHLENSKIEPFATTAQKFLEIISTWESLCKSDSYSICGAGGYEVILHRSLDGHSFHFETKK
jgi:hypothetical protein